MEIVYTLLYATLMGFYNVFRKSAVKKSNESAVLIMFTTLAFLLSMIWIFFGVAVPLKFILILAVKGLLLATSWFIILKVLKTADVSIVIVTNTLSAVLSFCLGIILFKETAGVTQIIGSVIVIAGVSLINLTNRGNKGQVTTAQFLLLLISALITTTSTVIDKYTTTYLTPFQTQFWYFFFLVVFAWILVFIESVRNKKFTIQKTDFKNFWIYLAGIVLFIGDFLLFQAYKVPNSKMITITILSKFKVVVGVLLSTIMLKEKNALKKILLSLLVLFGILLISIF